MSANGSTPRSPAATSPITPVSSTYELTPEQAFVFADEDSACFMQNAWAVPASMWFDEDKAIEAFRTGKGISWGDHDGRLYCGVAAF